MRHTALPWKRLAIAGGAALAASVGALAGPAQGGTEVGTIRVSRRPDGPGPVDGVAAPVISGDGWQVAFLASDGGLVPDDTNDAVDLFVRDVAAGMTRRVSVGAGGVEHNGGYVASPTMSAGGRTLVFVSDAANLVAGDTNGHADVFVRDVVRGATARMSVAGGQQADADVLEADVSADGRRVVFATAATTLVAGDTNGTSDVFLRDRSTRAVRRISVPGDGGQASGPSRQPVISPDGRFVVFTSWAADLVPGDTNGTSDVFVHDVLAGTTERVSVGPGERQSWGGARDDPTLGSHSPDVSRDGRTIVYESCADGLVSGASRNDCDAYFRLRPWPNGTTRRVQLAYGGAQGAPPPAAPDTSAGASNPSVSDDGLWIAYVSGAANIVPKDSNGVADVFVRNIPCGCSSRVSTGDRPDHVQADGASSAAAISGDAFFVAFASRASNLIHEPSEGLGASDQIYRRGPLLDDGRTPTSITSAGAVSEAPMATSGRPRP